MQGGVLHLEELAGSKSSERGRTRERGGGSQLGVFKIQEEEDEQGDDGISWNIFGQILSNLQLDDVRLKK